VILLLTFFKCQNCACRPQKRMSKRKRKSKDETNKENTGSMVRNSKRLSAIHEESRSHDKRIGDSFLSDKQIVLERSYVYYQD
jgi:hypothetical protein